MNCNMMIGEIKIFSGAAAPFCYEFCDGSHYDKVLYKNLYSVIGDVYNTSSTPAGMFSLPNLIDKVPRMSTLGSTGGSDSVTLTEGQLPSHNHNLMALKQVGNTVDPENAVLANAGGLDKDFSNSTTPNVEMNQDSISSTGDGLPIDIVPSYVGVNFIICTGV